MSQIGLWVADGTTRHFRYWSDESYRIWGFDPRKGLPSRDEMWGRIHPDIREKVWEEVQGKVSQKRNYAGAFRIVLPDGTLKHIEATSHHIFSARGELVEVVSTHVDVTERKRSETWLAQAQRLSNTGTWVLDGATKRFLHWSDESYRIWGFDPLKGLPSRDDMWGRVHPEDRERVWEEVQEALREQRDFFDEFRILLPDGTVKYLESNTYHEYSPLGALIEVVCTNVDVTERKRAQDERERLRQLETELAHLNRLSMMGELAASLAHEIKQPICAVHIHASTAMRFLDRSPPDLGEGRKALIPIVNNANRAADIIDRIRDHIKKAPPRKTCFDVNEAINDVIELARSAITGNRVSVQTRLAQGSLAIHGDRVQLQQVLLNLILNAIEAMGSAEAEARELLISTERDHKGVLVAVRDSGPGIDAAHFERIFEAFYSTKSSGTGLGLRICRSIVDAHGGKLWAEANEPRGAVFQFTLPVAQEDS